MRLASAVSSYVVDKQTVDEIVAGLVTYDLVVPELAEVTGRILVAENERSAHYRYALPPDPPDRTEYERTSVVCRVGQLARSITHYAETSCDYPGWTSSEARALCFRLAFALLAELPGYNEAEVR